MPRTEMTMRFNEEERAALDALAMRLGISRAAAVRLLVRGLVDGKLDVVRVNAAPLPKKRRKSGGR